METSMLHFFEFLILTLLTWGKGFKNTFWIGIRFTLRLVPSPPRVPCKQFCQKQRLFITLTKLQLKLQCMILLYQFVHGKCSFNFKEFWIGYPISKSVVLVSSTLPVNDLIVNVKSIYFASGTYVATLDRQMFIK